MMHGPGCTDRNAYEAGANAEELRENIKHALILYNQSNMTRMAYNSKLETAIVICVDRLLNDDYIFFSRVSAQLIPKVKI